VCQNVVVPPSTALVAGAFSQAVSWLSKYFTDQPVRGRTLGAPPPPPVTAPGCPVSIFPANRRRKWRTAGVD
jgi:hypothetical protein